MKGTSSTTTFTEKGFTNGQTERNTMVIGIETRCMVKEILCGRMDESTKETTNTTRSTATAFLNGMMEEDTREIGKMVNNMEEVYILM